MKKGEINMKTSILLVLGAITGWIVLGLITGDYGTDRLFTLILGLLVGQAAGKRPKN